MPSPTNPQPYVRWANVGSAHITGLQRNKNDLDARAMFFWSCPSMKLKIFDHSSGGSDSTEHMGSRNDKVCFVVDAIYCFGLELNAICRKYILVKRTVVSK